MRIRSGQLFALASLAWGVPYLFATVAIADMSVVFTVFARAALGALVLVPIAWRRGLFRPLRGRLRAVFLLGLGIGITGVALLFGVEVRGDLDALVGVLLVLSAALSYAGGALYFKRRFADVPAFGVVAAAMAACAVVTAVPGLLSLPTQVPSVASVVAIAVLGLGATAGGYLAFYTLINRVGSARASVITYIAPAIAVAGGVIFLHEPLTAGIVAGLLLVLSGSWLSTGGRPPGAVLRVTTAVRRSRGAPGVTGRSPGTSVG